MRDDDEELGILGLVLLFLLRNLIPNLLIPVGKKDNEEEPTPPDETEEPEPYIPPEETPEPIIPPEPTITPTPSSPIYTQPRPTPEPIIIPKEPDPIELPPLPDTGVGYEEPVYIAPPMEEPIPTPPPYSVITSPTTVTPEIIEELFSQEGATATAQQIALLGGLSALPFGIGALSPAIATALIGILGGASAISPVIAEPEETNMFNPSSKTPIYYGGGGGGTSSGGSQNVPSIPPLIQTPEEMLSNYWGIEI